MGKHIEFKRPDGQFCPAYLALPDNPTAPAIIVVQEWWGLNEQIKKTADRFAGEGYAALVPDLYRGRVTVNADEAKHLSTDLNFGDATHQDVRGAAQHLKAMGSAKVAVAGFCMGGALTILAGVHVPGIDGAVCFYGIPPAQAADPAAIRTPFLAHFADDDAWCSPSVVDALEKRLIAGKVSYEVCRYPAKHGFMNEARPEVYDPQSAALAWDRTIAFLRKTLG